MPPKKQQQAKKKSNDDDLDAILAGFKAKDQQPKKPKPTETKKIDVSAQTWATKEQQDALIESKKSQKKVWPAEQTLPEPTVPIDVLFKGKAFPVGEILDQPGDFNTFRTTSQEKKNLDRNFEKELYEARKGAEVHRTVRKWVQSYAKPGLKMQYIAETAENKIRELLLADDMKGGIGFPMGCSLNECAAHYTPNPGDQRVLSTNDVVKFDIGIHVNGRIIDCAWTMCFDDKYKPLLDTVKAATNMGIRTAGIDVRLCDVGAAIQEVMEAGEIELDGKVHKIKCVRNLCGHSIERYRIHAGKSVPIVKNDDQTKMEECEFFAIETFGSTGKGYVEETMDCSHYAKIHNAPVVNLSNAKDRHLLSFISDHFGTLPFCRRYLDRLGESKHVLALRHLVEAGIVQDYPPLCDVMGSYVAQFEHTLVLRPTCKEILSRGDDY
jgi:methionyl aminopeptidase